MRRREMTFLVLAIRMILMPYYGFTDLEIIMS